MSHKIINTSTEKINFIPFEIRRKYEIWNGSCRFFCNGRLYAGYEYKY